MKPFDYSTSLLIYQDKPRYGLLLRLILIIPLAFLVGSLYLYLSGDTSGSLALLPEAFIVGLIFWLVFPREYQVYEDHLRIVLGGPFGVNISFAQVRKIEVTKRTDITVNFATAIARTYVIIVKKRGLGVAITPKNNESFAEHANQALIRWLEMSNRQQIRKAL